MATLEQHILDLVRQYGPIKAADIAKQLSKKLKIDVNRSDVNSALYKMQTKVAKDEVNNTWTVIGPSRSRPASQKTPSTQNAPKLPFPSTGAIRKRRILPTVEQLRLIEFDSTGNLLVRGEAGSGKTTVLSERLDRIQARSGSEPVLFLTYNRALTRYVEQLSREIGHNAVDVQTFHGWARDVAGKYGHKIRGWYQHGPRERLVKECLQELRGTWGSHRFYQLPMGFWHDEFEWVFGRGLRSREAYRVVSRTGRGTGIQVRGDDRELVWDVLVAYQNKVIDQGCWDVDDPGGLVMYSRVRCTMLVPPTFDYGHIFIDEVQDFDKSWLEAIAAISNCPITMAGDLAQRIYKRSFTWKEVGISLPASHSQKLTGSFRTTKQIMQVAQQLAANPDLAGEVDYQAPTLPTREGHRVQRVIREQRLQVIEEVARWVAQLNQQAPSDSIFIAVPSARYQGDLTRELERYGLHASIEKGDELAEQLNTIQVSTYHQAKGLEWDHVVLMDLCDDQMPGMFLAHLSDPEEIAEAENRMRRVVYVALTRARSRVLLAGKAPFCRYFNRVPGVFVEDL